MRLRKPVQQKDGRPRPGATQKNTRFPDVPVERVEIVECSGAHDHISLPTAIRFRQTVPRMRSVDEAGAERD